MAFIEVQGGKKLSGELTIQGSKNAVLPMLAACILCKEPVEIANCPRIKDVFAMIDLLESVGCKTDWENNTLCIEAKEIVTTEISQQYTNRMRSSVLCLGSMLGRMGEVSIAYPGGCSIGARPIDIHLNCMKKMNIWVEEEECQIACRTHRLEGAIMELYYPSVGATENLILCAVFAKGTTKLIGAAREPEIQEFCSFLRSMGAKISGEETGNIVVEGVRRLHGIRYTLGFDRIVAGTYMAAVAGVGGEAFFHMNGMMSQLDAVSEVLQEMGVVIQKREEGIFIKSTERLKNIGLIRTKPYPGFPTDMQSQIMAVSSRAEGSMILIENVFEGRFRTVKELKKMGAHITVMGRAAIISGTKTLIGTEVECPDLRGGAALVIAGLMGIGTTKIHNIEYMERGYEDICGCMQSLGADIFYRSGKIACI